MDYGDTRNCNDCGDGVKEAEEYCEDCGCCMKCCECNTMKYLMTNTHMKLQDFKKDEDVMYIPPHANNSYIHKDNERGVISSINNKFVFVKFYKFMANVGYEGTTAQACYPKNLMNGTACIYSKSN